MEITNGNDNFTETIEYKLDKDIYIIILTFNSDEITLNIKKGNPYQYYQYETKFNFLELKEINTFFSQFQNVEKIGNLFVNLLYGKKINLIENQDLMTFSFINITEEKINLLIKKKELTTKETIDNILEIMEYLIKDIQQLKEENKILKEENKEIKEENKKIKEEINELIEFKLKTEEKENNEKYNNLNNSSILTDKEKIKMISNWIKPNGNIIYNQIYKATRDGGTGKDFHKYCDNQKPTLTLFESTNGYIFGGYISISWEGPLNWAFKGDDQNAFIFSVNNQLKFPIKNKSKVIYNQKNCGPDFGHDDIYLSSQFFDYDSSCSNNCYGASPEKIAGGSSFRIKELEVYLVQFD